MNHSETKKLVVTTGVPSANVFAERVSLVNEAGQQISTKTDAELNSRYARLATRSALWRTGAKGCTVSDPRATAWTGGTWLATSGQEHMVAIELIEGDTISSASFQAGSQAAVAPTNQWFTLRTLAGVLVAITADDTTTAWAANASKTLSFTTPYVVPSTGVYYVGAMVAAGTLPSFARVSTTGLVTQGPPILSATDSLTGRTTPAGAASTSTMANFTAIPYGWVS